MTSNSENIETLTPATMQPDPSDNNTVTKRQRWKDGRETSSSTENGAINYGESENFVFDLTRSLSQPISGGDDKIPSTRRSLDWFGGVFAAVALAQFSTCLFLRIGECD